MQEERDPEHDDESENVRTARAVHRPPASRNTTWSFRRQALPRTRTAKVIFDRSGEGLPHSPIPGDVRMETVRGPA